MDIANYFVNAGKKKVNMHILVWCKTNASPMCNGNLLPDIEYCLLFKEEGSPRFNDGYRLKSKFYVSGANKADKDDYEHPTIKPLELVKRHIEHSTQPGDVILDPFMGSGTTAVACKELGRHFLGFEINPEYHKIATDRLNGLTVKEAKADYIQDSLF